MKKVGIIGAGAWGIALGISLEKNGCAVCLWHYDKQKLEKLNFERTTSKLNNITISEKIKFTDSLEEVLNSDTLIYASPTQQFDTITQKIRTIKSINKPLVIACKGIDITSNKLLTEISNENLPDCIPVILSGPGFAIDLANGHPIAVTLASNSHSTLENVGQLLANNNFRPYFNDDVVGVQIGGALKNVIAIATGIAMGKKLGDGAVASLITRGMNEIITFGMIMGAKKETFFGLSGLGDLVLTATNLKSRNTKLGNQIGISDGLKNSSKDLTEGFYTTNAVYNISKKKKIKLPIIDAVYNILYNNGSVDNEIGLLMNRPLRDENTSKD